ncbi:MAG: hypothetical protein CVU84_10105 [Firmicutes bacterium HGW-Firmicutes-1]|jgi:uncharacterized protein YjbI with pentapeptide repeats|nr:MAG: hypothetical protein CVU84_10105 [Firmicutes bacterium HGW-Firmicutes-1]
MQKLNIKTMGKTIREIASQRKAENKTFCTDYLKTLSQDQNITPETVESNDMNCTDGYFELTKNEYKLTTFSDITFGKGKAVSEDDLIKISGVCFYYCSFSMCGFSNISFENCSFVGCDFIECYTLGMVLVFRNCSFVSRSLGKKSIEDMPSLFESCEFTVKFFNCDVSSIIFNKTQFYFSYFENVNMYDAIFLDCSFDTTQIRGCNLKSTRIINPKFIEFYVDDLDKKTKVDRKTFLDYICYNKKEKREVRDAIEVYYAFSELFENNKIMDFSGEYFFLSQTTGIRQLEGFAKFKSIISLIACGYGERPSYGLMTSMTLVLVCGTLYMIFGVNVNNEVFAFQPTLGNLFPTIDNLIMWYHFSLVTFCTVGYGNVLPIGGSLIVSAIEMVLGVVMIGIWVSTLVRKMTRN